MPTLLLVEDDPIISESLKLALELQNFSVLLAATLVEAERAIKGHEIQLVLLDVNLPDGLGFDFCESLRSQGYSLPVLMLTAQVDEDSIVRGFSAGANDYIKKPFSQRELFARIAASLRTHQSPMDKMYFEDLTLWLGQRKAFIGSVELSLNRREYDLLRYFIENPEMVITREMIVQRLNDAEDINDRTVDSHVSHIRAKLKKAGSSRVRLKAEYGIGYRLTNYES